MKHGSILFLKIVILLIATGVLFWMIRFPQLEGRALDLDLISIYTDPFIIYGYIASIPFFVGLYQALKLLHYIERNKAFSQGAVTALRNIKFSALSLIGFIAAAVLYFHFFARGDDPAGPTALGILLSFAAAVTATAAAVLQNILQEGKYKK
jgi:hypothetical protein